MLQSLYAFSPDPTQPVKQKGSLSWNHPERIWIRFTGWCFHSISTRPLQHVNTYHTFKNNFKTRCACNSFKFSQLDSHQNIFRISFIPHFWVCNPLPLPSTHPLTCHLEDRTQVFTNTFCVLSFFPNLHTESYESTITLLALFKDVGRPYCKRPCKMKISHIDTI